MAEPSDSWLPTAEWCGRLILPDASDRRADGSVSIELLQVPDSQRSTLQGQIRRLRLDAEWVDRVSVSIEFDLITKNSIKNGMIHPERLNGWEQVSPLESLAGARPQNDILVMLDAPKEEDDCLVIEKEPVQISGTFKALARFVVQEPEGNWTIQHWDQDNDDFVGPTESIQLSGRDSLDPAGGDQLNTAGWYVYAVLDDSGSRVIKGMEPRHLFQIEPDLLYTEKEQSLRFLKYCNWQKGESKKGQTSRIHLSPPGSDRLEIRTGDKALVLHLFGAIADRPGRMAGHFSYGMAEVVIDPFTGDPRLQIEYKQIYAHNVDGVVSGSSQWHCYMGDTSIGKLAIRPVCDYLVFLPELFDESHGQSAYSILEKRFAEMTARYRTGEGDGLSRVSSAQNCSQDSSQALYAGIWDWQEALKNSDLTPRIATLGARLREHITPLFGLVPWALKRTAKRLPARRRVFRILPAIKSYKTIVPRSNADGLAESAVRANMPVVLLRTEIVGSTDEDMQPAPPIRPW